MSTLSAMIPAHDAFGPACLTVSGLLIYGLWRMSSPSTSGYGTRLVGFALLLAVLASFLPGAGLDAATPSAMNLALAAGALIFGGGYAGWRARHAALSGLAPAVALCTALGGGAVATISELQLFGHPAWDPTARFPVFVAAWLGVLAGTGSAIGWARLSGRIRSPERLAGRSALLAGAVLAGVALGGYLLRGAAGVAPALWPIPELQGALLATAALCALLISGPVNAAQIPIAVSVYQVFAGLGLALLGVTLQMPVLMSAGMLMAGAALLVAQRLAQAMHRGLGATLFGDLGAEPRTRRALPPADAAIFLRYARRVVIVPGYGLAAAQAQHKLEELIQRLLGAGVQVTLAVHPMAGRMPSQLHGLLADAGVAERLILPMESIEEALRAADVALVIGANDVANPAAAALKSSPVFGMPLIHAALAEKLYVIKRGAGMGFAAIENRTFHGENCQMIYGDAVTVLVQMLDALKVADLAVAA